MDTRYWFIFVSNTLLLTRDNTIPLAAEPPVQVKDWTYIQELPDMDGHTCRAFQLDTPPQNISDFQTIGLRDSFQRLPLQMYNMAGKAWELLYWNQNTRYCGVCGAPMHQSTTISKRCSNCGKEIWPQVAPAVIVRIRKAATTSTEGLVLEPEKILLVHARNFRRKEMYGLVAGFVETGETLEECLRREVREEVHLEIENIQYFSSSPWPYPSGIMVGFTADYKSGDIRLQQEELSSAGWFSRDNMPPLPDKLSIARQLIDDWLQDN